ncbi:MAG TPA: nucleotidyltransferase family protein [Longimicrobium sp.]|nr:nucleotidyltransferase family protein [Longimicrobium sp.]
MNVHLDRDDIEAFCRRWNVAELALFGSVLRDDFREDSDVDVLVEFARGARLSLFHFVEMQDELAELFGRRVDLVEKRALKNPFVRHHVLHNHEVLYRAA